MSEAAVMKSDDTKRKHNPTIALVDAGKEKAALYEKRKAEREELRRKERAKAKAEKLALINCIETLVKGIKGELEIEE